MIVERFLKSKHLPWILSILAIVIMLPALKTGFVMDDLIQRIPQLRPSQLPPKLQETGLVPKGTGELSTVLFDTFGFPRDKTLVEKGRNYGIAPWWLCGEIKCSLWRPFTALTHWIDYRLFPDSPALMHAHNIAWFTAIVFLAAVIYRKIIGPIWVAGLAALMFVLDKNTYFPVMFIANRGFVVALCFGVLCFYAHHKWRTTNSAFAACLSFVFFSLSLLSNEAGFSTFAFVLAYALVLDKAPLSKRLLSLLPAILIIIIWRIIYQSLGYGVSGVGPMYIDPGHEPLRFLYYLPAYGVAVIAGQLSGLPPDIMLGFNSQLCSIIFIFYAIFIAVALLVFLPIILRDTTARFWFLVFVFAAIPVASAPSGKNFGFVAIGAFGFLAVFAAGLIKNLSWLPASKAYRGLAWILCITLLAVHIPFAIVSRFVAPKVAPAIISSLANAAGCKNLSLSGDRRVVIVNAPCQLSTIMIPFNIAFDDKPIPKSIRALASAYTALEIERTDEKTLVIRSKEDNFFTSNQDSPLHFSHVFAIFDKLCCNSRMFEENRRFVLEGMTVDVLDLDDSGLPREITFTFDAPLEDKEFRWLQFNWRTFSYEPFILPAPGETVRTPGPPVVRFRNAVRFLLSGR
jgi:hypothetical protein